MRCPTDKQRFFEGVRQKWFAIMLLFAGMVLFLDCKYDVDPEPYLTFLTIAGSVFILGGSIDSALKIQKSKVE